MTHCFSHLFLHLSQQIKHIRGILLEQSDDDGRAQDKIIEIKSSSSSSLSNRKQTPKKSPNASRNQPKLLNGMTKLSANTESLLHYELLSMENGYTGETMTRAARYKNRLEKTQKSSTEIQESHE